VWQVHQTSLQSNSISPSMPAQLQKSEHIYIPIQTFHSIFTLATLTAKKGSAKPPHHNFVHRFQYISPSFLPFWTLLPIHASHRDQESPSRLPSTTLLHTFCIAPCITPMPVCSHIGSTSRWLLQCTRCCRWGWGEYGNGARGFGCWGGERVLGLEYGCLCEIF
jgi:hypothetical protein